MEFKNNNDYSCIVFLANGRQMKMQYVHSIIRLKYWLKDKSIDYKYINIYVRRSGRFLIRNYPNQFINSKPK